MAKFGTKEEILLKIQTLFDRMNSGKLSLEELNELATLTAELHERTVILRYKAIEARVFEHHPDPVVEASEEMEALDQQLETGEGGETEGEGGTERGTGREAETEREGGTEAESAPLIDFSMFEEETEETPAFSFDEPEKQDSIPEQKVEPEIPASQPSPAPTPTSAAEKTTGNSFAERLQTLDNSLAGKLKLSKLESLVGSFGMNERLQYINELFDGSGEAFSDAVKSLDNQQTLDEARRIAFRYSDEYSWDIDSETVAEFMQKLDRRYA